MIFLLGWLICYILITLAMIHDNFWWAPSSPEWDRIRFLGIFRPNQRSVIHETKEYKTIVGYMIKYRAWAVIKDYRDIIPALLSSLLLNILVSLIW